MYRTVIAPGLVLCQVFLCVQALAAGDSARSADGCTLAKSSVHVGYRDYLANHDVAYESLTDNAYDGLPLGNGRMGGIVQARPYGIKLLVNRADVLGVNSYTDVTTETRKPLHRANCCGWLEIDFGEGSFPADTFQGLEYHNALGTIVGGGIAFPRIRFKAWSITTHWAR